MAQINYMKDIGVIMDSDLKFEKHMILTVKLIQQTKYWE